jgi:hypothetical protein
MSYAEAKELGRAALALRADNPMMSLPEAVRRVMSAQRPRGPARAVGLALRSGLPAPRLRRRWRPGRG